MQALALGEQNKEHIRADKLQKLHTLHNLAQLLKGGLGGVPGIPRTLRDSSLESEAQSVRDGYLAESIAKLAVAHREYQDSLHGMDSAADNQQPAGQTSDLVQVHTHYAVLHPSLICQHYQTVKLSKSRLMACWLPRTAVLWQLWLPSVHESARQGHCDSPAHSSFLP